MEKKRYYKKKGGEAHMGREWDSDEDDANIAINKGLLFPNVSHKFLMAKDGKKKKVHFRDISKYTTSDDEGSSSDNDDDDLISLFANLTMDQKKKLNKLIETINEKDDLLERLGNTIKTSWRALGELCIGRSIELFCIIIVGVIH